ncbi:MAG TPA: O-antigen ligase family protein [Salinivirgaceae bacterium]|mgnify:CR=1 FL=1|nr:O-antigen ligase family protein [Salinivirgaceae bacterium]HQA75772.1 O-antigen ligase family protein [Salinivirgaceae bacterium]
MKALIAVFKEILKKGPIGIYLMTLIIPISSKPLGIVAAIIFFEAVVRKQLAEKENIQKQLNWRNPGVWIFAFYFMHIFGLFCTENTEFAFMDLGMKAAFAIFPLIFLFYQPVIKWQWFVNAFIAGALISIIINIIISVIIYSQVSSSLVFTSRLMHRGYWTIYLIIAIFFLLNKAFDTQIKKRRDDYLLLTIFISVFLVLTLCRTGLAIFSILLLWFIVNLCKRVNKWISVVIVTSIVLGTISVYLFFSPLRARVDSIFFEIQKKKEEYNMYRLGNVEARILTWESSIQVIKDNFWFGVGTGDVKDKLDRQYLINGYFALEKYNLNSHNQFLNSHVALGVFAPLFLLMAFFCKLAEKKSYR